MRQSKRFVSAAALMTLAAALNTGCATAPKGEEAKANLGDEAETALKHMYRVNPSLEPFIAASTGYVVFPEVGQGGLIVGGSYGRGILYQGGKAVGYADISKASVGATAGGQTFTEIVVFESTMALQNFKDGHYAFAADASAVALKETASASLNYKNGVAVFVDSKGGLAVDASVGGQKFSYVPM